MEIGNTTTNDFAKTLENPDLVMRHISYFENTDWKLEDIEKIEVEYRKRLGLINDITILKKGSFLYRARINNEENLAPGSPDFLFKKISELSINSRERTKSFGRAHCPGRPAFYSCLDPSTAVHEIIQWDRNQKGVDLFFKRLDDLEAGIVEVGDKPGQGFSGIDVDGAVEAFNKSYYITISKWETQEDIRLSYFLDKALLSGEMRKMIEWNALNDPLLRVPGTYKVRKSMGLIKDFFIRQFTKINNLGESDYLLTAMCANLIYKIGVGSFNNAVYGAEGILYSSVAEKYKGLNCVLSEDVIKTGKVKFISADCQIYKQSNRNSMVPFGRMQSLHNDEILWDIDKSKVRIYKTEDGTEIDLNI